MHPRQKSLHHRHRERQTLRQARNNEFIILYEPSKVAVHGFIYSEGLYDILKDKFLTKVVVEPRNVLLSLTLSRDTVVAVVLQEERV